MNNAKFVLNNEKKGIEIYFTEKPNQYILDVLKSNKWKWHKVKKCWYNKQSEANLYLAQTIVFGDVEVKPRENKQNDNIKIGFKDKPKYNYTGRGWEGINYQHDLDIVEVGKIIKKQLKKDFPTAKFSITTEKYRGGQAMTISYMEDVEPAFIDSTRTHAQVNHYYIKDDERLTERAKKVLQRAVDLANSFNFDDSDGMIDYFHTNFYVSVEVGKYDKPFKVKK